MKWRIGIDVCKLCRWFTSTKDTQKERVGVNEQCQLQWKQWLKETKCPMSIRAAAAKFDIPYPTLRKHIIKGSATKLLGRFHRTFSNDQESELGCITRPVSCLWHNWSSSYSAWPFTVSVRYSWISHRLDSVVHHESLADSASQVTCRPSLWSPAACLKGSVLGPILFLLYTADVTNICAMVWTFIHVPTIPICTSTVTQWTVQLRQRD